MQDEFSVVAWRQRIRDIFCMATEEHQTLNVNGYLQEMYKII